MSVLSAASFKTRAPYLFMTDSTARMRVCAVIYIADGTRSKRSYRLKISFNTCGFKRIFSIGRRSKRFLSAAYNINRRVVIDIGVNKRYNNIDKDKVTAFRFRSGVIVIYRRVKSG